MKPLRKNVKAFTRYWKHNANYWLRKSSTILIGERTHWLEMIQKANSNMPMWIAMRKTWVCFRSITWTITATITNYETQLYKNTWVAVWKRTHCGRNGMWKNEVRPRATFSFAIVFSLIIAVENLDDPVKDCFWLSAQKNITDHSGCWLNFLSAHELHETSRSDAFILSFAKQHHVIQC